MLIYFELKKKIIVNKLFVKALRFEDNNRLGGGGDSSHESRVSEKDESRSRESRGVQRRDSNMWYTRKNLS